MMPRVLTFLVAVCIIAFGLTSIGASCEKHPVIRPYDAGDVDGLGTTIGEVCASLRRAGCPEGFPTKSGGTCYQHLERLEAFIVGAVPSECLLEAGTQDAVRLCGADNPTRYTRFRCKQ